MTTTNEHTERAEFEKYFVRSNRRGTKHAANALAKNEHGYYIDDSTQRHWWTWQNATKAAAMLEAQRPALKPLTEEQLKAALICRKSERVSVSEVQRKLSIGYKAAQELCQSIVDAGLVDGLLLSPSLVRNGITGEVQPAADDKAGGEPVAKIRITEFGSANNRKKAAHVDTLIPIDQFNSLPDGALLYTHPQPQAEVRVPDGYVLVKLGFGKVEVASGNHEGVPALIFGKNGTGIIGEATQPDRMHAEGETLACVTFENAESLEVVQHHINEVRDMLAAAPKPQDDLPAILKKQAS